MLTTREVSGLEVNAAQPGCVRLADGGEIGAHSIDAGDGRRVPAGSARPGSTS